ncbi:Protein ltv1, partial [Linderina macrospora]
LSTVRNAMLKEGQGVDESRKELLEKGLEMIEEANERAANDDYADLDAQFQEKQRVPWDCQTILTTYSTLDNHPATIHEKRAPRIKVSRKTGFPMVENPDEENEKKEEEEEEEQEERINKGEARSKGETKEEKRLRKQQLKEAKRDRREQKRETQGVFAEKRDRKMQSRKDRAQYVIHMD